MEQYLTIGAAREVILSLNSKGRFILGIERLVLTERGKYPDLNSIADFSSSFPSTNIAGNTNDALEFLSQFGQDENERFVITADDEPAES